jgi:hypothetical protein
VGRASRAKQVQELPTETGPMPADLGVISYALCLLLLARSVYREAALFVAAVRGGEAV